MIGARVFALVALLAILPLGCVSDPGRDDRGEDAADLGPPESVERFASIDYDSETWWWWSRGVSATYEHRDPRGSALTCDREGESWIRVSTYSFDPITAPPEGTP